MTSAARILTGGFAWTGGPITRKMRNDAAKLCSIMACSYEYGHPQENFAEPCATIGVECFDYKGPAELARMAFWYVDEVKPALPGIQKWAEAESLLRTGWSPA